MKKLIKEHKFALNGDKEQLTITTSFYEGSKKQSLCLEKTKVGYTVDVFNVQLTPELLRKFADELEEAEKSLTSIPKEDLLTLEGAT